MRAARPMETRIVTSQPPRMTPRMSGPASGITASMLSSLLAEGSELAIVDVREGGAFARGHLLFARSVPLSSIELQIRKLVPRYETPIVLIDDGGPDAEARTAAAILVRNGYGDLACLEGGVSAWLDAGHALFQGVNVPSKAFGEYVEHHLATPGIDAEELALRFATDAPPLLLDARTFEEYGAATIPGSISCPGAELALRAPQLLEDPDRLVVVHCAGRTRSIIGAQTLIESGLRNPVRALRNGTIGWRLAGYHTASGNAERAPVPPPGRRPDASFPSDRGAAHSRPIDWATYQKLASDPARTVFAFDVRDPEEFRREHPRGFRNAPGGQLVQATDLYVGVLAARIVLYDDQMLRALTTAAWLRRMGWPEVHVIDPETVLETETGDERPVVLFESQIPRAQLLSPRELADMIASVHLIDFANSEEFATAHIPGGRFAIRSRLDRSLDQLERGRLIVLTSPDGMLARFAAPQVERHWPDGVKVLESGTAGWKREGLALESGFENPLDPPEDMWHRPTGPLGRGEESMREYISWEVGLLDQITGEPGLRFSLD